MPSSLDAYLSETFARYEVRQDVQDFIRDQYTNGALKDVFDAQTGLSAHIDGAQAVFYSGELQNAGGDSVRAFELANSYADYQNSLATEGHTAAYTISQTDRGLYIEHQDAAGGALDQAKSAATEQFGELTDQEKAAFSEPVWRSASEAMGTEAVGDVKAFVSPTASENGAFAAEELPALLDRSGGTINGMAASEFSGLNPTDALSHAAASTTSYMNDVASGSLAPESMVSQLEHGDYSGLAHPPATDFGNWGEGNAAVADFIEGGGRALGALGVAAMAVDATLSTSKALGQVEAGDYQGALNTESAMAARLSMGLYGAEVGAAAFGELGLAIGGPAGAAAGAIMGGVLGGLTGAITGNLVGTTLGQVLGGILQQLGIPMSGPAAPWNLGNVLHPPGIDPLVIDLSGDGFQLISVATSTAHVDFAGDGYAERVGWLAPSDGFLVVDPTGGGSVSVPGGLIGGPAQDGFNALASYDSNGDHKIDVSDSIFGSLKIWRDLNGDGVAQAGELSTLAQNHIASISLASSLVNQISAGNLIAFEATVTRDDGTSTKAGSAYFAVDNVLSKWVAPDGFMVSDAAKILPNLPGFGTVKDLASATTLDDHLRQAASNLVVAADHMSISDLKSGFQSLLYEWTGADHVDPTSRGGAVDAQHLAVLEAFYGTTYSEVYLHTGEVSNDPSGSRAVALEAAYQDLFNSNFLQFVGQTPASYVQLTGDGSELAGSPFTPLALLTGADLTSPVHFDAAILALKALAPSGESEISYFGRAMPVLAGAVVDVFGGDEAAFANALHADFQDQPAMADAAIGLATMPLLENTGAASLSGSAAGEVLWGHNGQSLAGGGGDDLYLWNHGGGTTVITEAANGGARDQLLLLDVAPSAVSLVRSGDDVTLQIAPSTSGGTDGGSVKLVGGLIDYFDQGVEKVTFADGTTWSRLDMRVKVLAQAATSGADSITGFINNDTLTGGAGDDSLAGGSGDDTYIWGRGDGADVITEGTNAGAGDQLTLLGVNPADVTLVRSGNDVTLQIAPTTPGGADGGSVKLLANLDDYFDQGVDKIVFADGTSWTRADLRLAVITQSETAGNDSIAGFGVADTLAGGAGDDTLAGGGGDDTYIWSRGDGNDLISEPWFAGSGDRLVLHGVTPADVTLVRDGGDVTLHFAPSTAGGADGGSVKLLANLEENYDQGVDKIAFDDGTTWTRADLRSLVLPQGTAGADNMVGFNSDDVLSGAAGADTIDGVGGNDTITGGAGDDSLVGGGGDDTFVWSRGDGNDLISEPWFAGSGDKLILQSINPQDVTLVRDGGDVTLQIAPSAPGGADGGSVKLLANLEETYDQGVDKIVFADGTSWTRADLRLKLITQSETAGNDSVTGFGTADTLAGGAGDDTLAGGSGDDTYVWSRGDGNDLISEPWFAGSGDKLVLHGVASNQVTVSSSSGGDVLLAIAPTAAGAADGGAITLVNNVDDYYDRGVDKIVFDDGSSWTRADLRSHLDGTWIGN